MSDGIKRRLDEGIDTAENPKWALKYLNSTGPKQLLTGKEHAAFTKRAKKAMEEGKTPANRFSRYVKAFDSEDAQKLKLMFHKLETDKTFIPEGGRVTYCI